ncbi:MAG: family 16 glycosylhydrolase [Planctomycetota bacterium]
MAPRHLAFPALLALAAAAANGQQLLAPLSADSPASAPLHDLGADGVRLAADAGWIEFELQVDVTGRYRCEVLGLKAADGGEVWVEDHVGNPDGRTYDITGPTAIPADGSPAGRSGAPLAAGPHRMRLHLRGGPMSVRAVAFTLLRPHGLTPTTMVQRTDGAEWTLVWSDEFDGEGTPDPRRWTADLGDWGWGNRELQHYTDGRVENARQEDGNLVIEARRHDLGHAWTSARLTTRGKVGFLYGRIEIRAKVPAGDGTWAAGWLLGDAYRDERSWPYCGEIDVLEGVGREIDDRTGDGLNHASCHTRAYYFKQGNHISSQRAVRDMAGEFHTYELEWLPGRITVALDGEPYYVYDKTDGPLEWPFDQPQTLVLNLAIGGGMGGAVDPALDRARFVVDYVRVYGRR